ncbi:hypothetical protein FQA39_LY02786 [Lamprigera yunnana]|nr:hypothetical protein FQA39_LY02786 [Lamprigera yunnana]
MPVKCAMCPKKNATLDDSNAVKCSKCGLLYHPSCAKRAKINADGWVSFCCYSTAADEVNEVNDLDENSRVLFKLIEAKFNGLEVKFNGLDSKIDNTLITVKEKLCELDDRVLKLEDNNVYLLENVISEINKRNSKKFKSGVDRPLKVVFPNKDCLHWFFHHKKMIIEKSKKSIIITGDLTNAQRDFRNKVLSEIKLRREKGEDNLFMKYINGIPTIVWLIIIFMNGFLDSYKVESILCSYTEIISTTTSNGNFIGDGYDYYVCCDTYYRILSTEAKCSFWGGSNTEVMFNFLPDHTKPKRVHQDDNYNVTGIQFYNSYIPNLNVGIFSQNTYIVNLDITACGVQSIQPGALSGLIHLEELELGENNISEITRGTFNQLLNLVTLNLSKNRIESIEDNSFSGLFNLKNLLLNNNKIKIISDRTFQGLKTATKLNLTDEEDLLPTNTYLSLSEIYSANFLDLPEATYLNLGNNKISTITHFKLPFLDYINLNNNNISNLTEIDTSITYLNLSRNIFKELHSGLLRRSRNLRYLDLSKNLISCLTPDAFDNASNLVLLHLQNNLVDFIPIGIFKNLNFLVSLNLSSNLLSDFEYGTFVGLSSLALLDISNNSLTYIYESIFNPLHSLQKLQMNNNFLTTIDPHSLLIHLSSLREISLSDNLWNCKSLAHLFITFNSTKVLVKLGSTTTTTNVYGISCTNSITVPNTNVNFSIESSQFMDFFNKEFFNTGFYKFFHNYTKVNLENSLSRLEEKINTVLKSPNMSSSVLIETLNSTIFKLFTEFKLSKENVRNYTLNQSNNLESKISKYFNEEFTKSSYFNSLRNDHTNIQTLTKTLENTLRSLNILNEYISNDFKNTSFYKLLTTNADVSYNNLLLDHGSQTHSEKLTHNLENQSAIGNANFQNHVILLLVIIVIIFVALFATQVYKDFNKHHLDEIEVKDYLKFPKNTKEGRQMRRNILALLRYEVKFEQCVQTEEFQPDKLPCAHCKRIIAAKYLRRHYKNCIVHPINETGRNIRHPAASQTLLACANEHANVTATLRVKKEVFKNAEENFALLRNDRTNTTAFKKLVETETYLKNFNASNQTEFIEQLTESKKALTTKYKRVVAGGKGSRAIVILFPPNVQNYINLLLQIRQESEIVPLQNKYLFAYPGVTDQWVRGDIVLKKFANSCKIEHPEAMTSNRLRKQIATLMQIINLDKTEYSQFARFMGHTEKTHQEYYEITQDAFQAAKVAKLLRLFDKGRGTEYRNKTLDNINIDPNNEIAECDDNADNDGGIAWR